MDLVEDHKSILIVAEKQGGIGELGAILAGLKVEVDRWRAGGDRLRKRRLPDLPWAD